MKPDTKKLIVYFLSALALILASHLLNNNERFHPSLQTEAEKLQGKLHQKETVLEDKLKELSGSYTNDFTNSLPGLYNTQLFNEEGILFLIYEEGELRYWSDNSVPLIDELTPRRNYDSAMQKLSNGWYLSKTIRAGNKTFVGLLLLKNEYPFENKYLQNGFNKCFDTDEGVEISLTKGKGNPEIKTKNGTWLFSLAKSGKSPSLHLHNVSSILLFIAGLCFLLLSLSGFLNSFPKAKLVLFPLSVLFIRAVMLYFQYPQALYTLPLFDPAYFAFSALFPSLGDFLLNMLTIALLVFYVTQKINSANDGNRNLKETRTSLNIIYGSAFLLFAISLHFSVSFLFKRLIVDSDIDFTINNLFSLSFFSYAGLFITWLMLGAWFLVLNKSVEFIEQNTAKEKTISFFLAVLFFAATGFITGNTDLPGMGIIVLICGALLLIRKRGKNSRSVFSSATLLLGFSVYAAYLLANFQKEKAEIKELFFAEKLAAKQDPVAEYIFPEVADEIQNDRIIKNMITLLPLKQEEFFSRLEQKFLNDYIQKYDVRINVFDTNDSLIASNNKLSRTFDFYINLESLSKATSGKYLLYSYEADNEINYLGRINFTGITRETKEKHTTIFIEFEEKI